MLKYLKPIAGLALAAASVSLAACGTEASFKLPGQSAPTVVTVPGGHSPDGQPNPHNELKGVTARALDTTPDNLVISNYHWSITLRTYIATTVRGKKAFDCSIFSNLLSNPPQCSPRRNID